MYDVYGPIHASYTVQAFGLAFLVFALGIGLIFAVAGAIFKMRESKGTLDGQTFPQILVPVFIRMMTVYIILCVVVMLGVSLAYIIFPEWHLTQYTAL